MGRQGRQDRLADTAGGIMVFHGDEALGGFGGRKQGGRVHRLDAVEVDDPDVDAFLLQGFVGGQGFKQGDAGADDRGQIAGRFGAAPCSRQPEIPPRGRR